MEGGKGEEEDSGGIPEQVTVGQDDIRCESPWGSASSLFIALGWNSAMTHSYSCFYFSYFNIFKLNFYFNLIHVYSVKVNSAQN